MAAHSGVDERSILRAYRGQRVREATMRRIASAASACDVSLPGAVDPVVKEALAVQVREEAARIAPLVPDVDMHDLQLILERRLRPWGTGQLFFIRRGPDGHYVF